MNRIFLKFNSINSIRLTNSRRFDMVFLNPTRRLIMAKKLDSAELVSFKELLMANAIQIDALTQLLIDKGLITQQEFFTKLKQVQSDYQSKRHA
jgi:hypothetical protein